MINKLQPTINLNPRPSPYRAVNTISVSVIKTSQSVPYREIIVVYSKIDTKHINTVYGQNAGIPNVKPGGTHSNHWGLGNS